MKRVKVLLLTLVPLIAVTALPGCDTRLPRPWEPTVPQKGFVSEWQCRGPTLLAKLFHHTD
jgi:hypothetical protein